MLKFFFKTARRFNLLLSSIGLLALMGGGLWIFVMTARPLPAYGASVLASTTESLELVTATAGTINVTVSYIDYTSTTATPGAQASAITTATTTTILSAPAASTQRQVKLLTVDNAGTASVFITLQKDVSATNYSQFSLTLGPSETLRMKSDGDFDVHDSTGAVKSSGVGIIDGTTVSWLKVGATSEATGLIQMMAKDTGFPGAWVPGTPGLNGDALDCSTAADAVIAGAPLLTAPASGNYFLTTVNAAGSVAEFGMLVDLIWYNTGLVVTTTTAQNTTLPTLPNRDQYGTNNGEGWQAAIYVTTATTNAGAVTNTTLSYTDSDGNAGNTATMASFPATAVAGAFIPFQLAAGDRGIRNIASVTLGTSLVTGAVSLVLYRPLAYIPMTAANVGGTYLPANAKDSGAKLWPGTCLWFGYQASATTALTANVAAQLTVR